MKYHDVIVQQIINHIPAKWSARKCLNERHDGFDENSMLRPDINIVADEQCLDLVISIDKNRAFADKAHKY